MRSLLLSIVVAAVSASMIPDGMYPVTVKSVKSPLVMTVTMEHNLEVEVRAASHTAVTFSNLSKDAHVRIMIVEGQVVGVVKQ